VVGLASPVSFFGDSSRFSCTFLCLEIEDAFSFFRSSASIIFADGITGLSSGAEIAGEDLFMVILPLCSSDVLPCLLPPCCKSRLSSLASSAAIFGARPLFLSHPDSLPGVYLSLGLDQSASIPSDSHPPPHLTSIESPPMFMASKPRLLYPLPRDWYMIAQPRVYRIVLLKMDISAPPASIFWTRHPPLLTH